MVTEPGNPPASRLGARLINWYLGADEKAGSAEVRLIHSSNEHCGPMGITMQRFFKHLLGRANKSCSFLEATLWNGREWLRDGSWQDKVFDSRLTQGGPPALLGSSRTGDRREERRSARPDNFRPSGKSAPRAKSDSGKSWRRICSRAFAAQVSPLEGWLRAATGC